jgi:MFS family permease
LVVLAGISFLQALDQTVLSAVAANIQAEFSLSDTQVGTLVSAFVIAIALAPQMRCALNHWRTTVIETPSRNVEATPSRRLVKLARPG